MDPLSLYLHIPFCRHRCAYCDFNTYTSVGELKEAYATALAHEIRQAARLATAVDQLRPVHTVFFGGGTPSLMSPASLAEILDAARTTFGFTAAAEISLEANPETVDAAYLAALRALGINRLSFGMQSALPHELQLLERTHGLDTVATAVADARTAGFDSFNLDLIYGLPGQSVADWERSLDAVLALDPPHISLYCLTIEPGTPMARWLRSGRILAPDPDIAAEQYELACTRLGAAAYEHYEISNWARPGHACRHNLTYWRNQEYLGLGAGAHGHANGYRYAVVKQPRVYIRRMAEGTARAFPLTAAVAEAHALDMRERMADTVLMQLRLLDEGLDLVAFEQRFGTPLDDAYDGLVSRLTEWGLVQGHHGRLRLTERGWFISNQVFYRFMTDD